MTAMLPDTPCGKRRVSAASMSTPECRPSAGGVAQPISVIQSGLFLTRSISPSRHETAECHSETFGSPASC